MLGDGIDRLAAVGPLGPAIENSGQQFLTPGYVGDRPNMA